MSDDRRGKFDANDPPPLVDAKTLAEIWGVSVGRIHQLVAVDHLKAE
jgi:hypothetical protein